MSKNGNGRHIPGFKDYANVEHFAKNLGAALEKAKPYLVGNADYDVIENHYLGLTLGRNVPVFYLDMASEYTKLLNNSLNALKTGDIRTNQEFRDILGVERRAIREKYGPQTEEYLANKKGKGRF